jgi:hypothetical protein
MSKSTVNLSVQNFYSKPLAGYGPTIPTSGINNIVNNLFSTQSISSISISNLTILNTLTVNGSANINNLNVTGASGIDNLTVTNLTVTGIVAFNNATFNHITLTDTSNQIIVGTTPNIKINIPIGVINRIYTVPDIGINADFVLTEGNQTINGIKEITTLESNNATIENFLASNIVIPTTSDAVITHSVSPTFQGTFFYVGGFRFTTTTTITVTNLKYLISNLTSVVTPNRPIGIFRTSNQMLLTPGVVINAFTSPTSGLYYFENIPPLVLPPDNYTVCINIPGDEASYTSTTGVLTPELSTVPLGCELSFVATSILVYPSTNLLNGQTITGVSFDYNFNLITPDYVIKSGSSKLGFFGVPPVSQQPHPVTLSDVINVLTNYGLTT